MKEILDKLSTYNIFNYIFPGILFVVFAEQFTSYIFIKDNILEGGIAYYFIGLVISRFGSIVLEPFLKRTKIIQFSDYSDFIFASQKDEKINLLSEQNNMFRSLVSMFVLLLLLKCCEFLSKKISFLNQWGLLFLFILLIILFIISYRKQTIYIKERIRVQKEQNEHS